jgi:hypothetical protein
MSRRVSLPGAEELFRTTSTTLSALPTPGLADKSEREQSASPPARSERPAPVRTTARRRVSRSATAPSGRERHEEKITVYLSPEELFDLEQARLTLRGDMGLAVDRGRIVREAVAVIVADLEAKGESSILARRLRGQ